MTAPIRFGEDPLDALKALKQKRAPETTDPLDELKATRANAGPFANVEGGSSSTAPDPATRTRDRIAKETFSKPSGPRPILQMLGTLASLGRDIPGVEALQAGAGSLVSHSPGAKWMGVQPRSYTQSLADIRGAEESAPAAARIPARIAGGTLAALAMRKVPGLAPGGVMRQGAQYGILNRLFNADPAKTVENRLDEAPVEGALGAAGGKIAQGATNLGRTALASTLGRTAEALDKKITEATIENYGRAAAEGEAAGGTSPALAKTLENPRVKRYVDLVRDGEEGSPTSDADVAREVYKLMSRDRRGMQDMMTQNGYDAVKAREVEKLGAAMKRLRASTAEPTVESIPVETAQSPAPTTAKGVAVKRVEGTPAQQLARRALERHAAEAIASPPLTGAPGSILRETPGVMPSFPGAVATRAKMEGERTAFETAADAAKRIANKTSVRGKGQLTKSPEAFRTAIAKMTPEEARRALQGVLGRAKEVPLHPSANPMTGFGTLGGLMQRSRLSPFITQLDEQAGNDWPAILRAIGIATPP